MNALGLLHFCTSPLQNLEYRTSKWRWQWTRAPEWIFHDTELVNGVIFIPPVGSLANCEILSFIQRSVSRWKSESGNINLDFQFSQFSLVLREVRGMGGQREREYVVHCAATTVYIDLLVQKSRFVSYMVSAKWCDAWSSSWLTM